MEDDNIDFDLETLCNFVSSSIFDFLSSDDKSDATVNRDNQIPLDHHKQVQTGSCNVDVNYGQDPPPLDELDAHMDALLLECSKQFEEEELRQQTSKCMKLDTSLKSSPCEESICCTKNSWRNN